MCVGVPPPPTLFAICFNFITLATSTADPTTLEERKLNYLKTLPPGTVGTDGSYSCQFCSKTFPRLGYLKKHEQVRFANQMV